MYFSLIALSNLLERSHFKNMLKNNSETGTEKSVLQVRGGLQEKDRLEKFELGYNLKTSFRTFCYIKD